MKRFLTLTTLILMMTNALTLAPKDTSAQEKPDLQVALPAPDPGDKNNNFYDNMELYSLPVSQLVIDGEVENPGPVDLSKLTLRTVIAKEALLNSDGSNHFVGAYRYDGYSLFDILQNYVLNKKNKEEFRPIIDLYVIIENDKGEQVVLSWGEIYYPAYLHQIIIASRVGRIVPSKTKDLWPLPSQSKLVVVNDLLSERNISNPVKITVKSYPRSFTVNREMSPLISPSFTIESDGKTGPAISAVPPGFQTETLHTIFYGKGRGIHSTQPFSGIFMQNLLGNSIKITPETLKKGLVTMVGIDGYRSVYTVSEIMNRNDQSFILLVPCSKGDDGGAFRVFPSCDFFSDRAVKALSGIIITEVAK